MDLTLHWAPGSCARVPLIALEEIGRPFSTELVSFVAGRHRSPEYLAINPKGKVPVLIIDGEPLTENVAILTWLATTFPEAELLPLPDDLLGRQRVVADLAFCAASLHPIVTRLRIPDRYSETDAKGAWNKAAEAMAPNFALIDERLAAGWWYDAWSLMDAYLYWVWFRVVGAGFDPAPYPNYARHAAEIEKRPSAQRALAREEEAQAELAARGLTVQFKPVQ